MTERANRSDGVEQDRPLTGLRVVDFTAVLSGPYCTRILADLGAEVIKVEPPEGDHKRRVPPMRGSHSAAYAQFNAGKRSIIIDLKTKSGLATALELAATADVVVENWRPGIAEKLGVGYAQICEFRPDIVYCSISGYGQEGPKAKAPAYAPILHAYSGFEMAGARFAAQPGEPGSTGVFIGDIFAGMSAVAAINAALVCRARTGVGQHIDVSMYEGMLNLLVYELLESQFGEVGRRIYPALRTSDGRIVIAPTSERNFIALDAALPELKMLDDARFSDSLARIDHWAELMDLVEGWTRERSSAQCEAHLSAFDVPCSRHREPGEAFTDPQAQFRGSFAPVSDGGGEFIIPVAPFSMSRSVLRPLPDVSDLGADGPAIRAELDASQFQTRKQ